MKILPLLFSLGVIVGTAVQADVTHTLGATSLAFSGYLDGYYVEDFAHTPFNDRQITSTGGSPDYSDSRKDRFAINHALVDAKFSSSSFRGGIGIQDGTYVQKNYAIEDRWARHLFEAQLGFKPVEATPLWIDAGIFASHIGLESAISKDDWTPTRSLMADNTPYYESGAKITWDPNPRWEAGLYLLQGWQQIGRQNSNKALGTEVIFKPNDAVVLNSSTYIGQSPNSRARLRRYFHDFYVTYQATKTWSFALSADVGADQRAPGSQSLYAWTSAVAIARWQFAPNWSVATRLEGYHDPHGITIATGTRDNFVAVGGSVNLDRQIAAHVVVRLELRTLRTKDPLFVENNGLSDANSYATVSTAIYF